MVYLILSKKRVWHRLDLLRGNLNKRSYLYRHYLWPMKARNWKESLANMYGGASEEQTENLDALNG
ncbi:hypothetical protein SCARR_00110 [Pontiella sulfatireligans]|uniref:Uncharacterized protein n=1 Tax=Pontiella sulfatireligans TaxID=2750658 RepID=A0A6C2UDU0_9BACT|nr:hypothetical protein SCARR_00110 [Pontiella sulfatireligans]